MAKHRHCIAGYGRHDIGPELRQSNFGHLLPAAFAKPSNLSVQSAQQQLHGHMMNLMGTMDFYRFDYWRDFTGLDMVDLHEQGLS